MTISIRASSLPSYEDCPRKFGVGFLMEAGLLHDYGFTDVSYGRNNIGAAIGTACHEGAAEIMRETKRTGGKYGIQAAKAIAGVKLMEAFNHPVTMDQTSPNQKIAADATHKLLERWYHDLEITDEPVIIEKGYQATVDDDITITGTVDQFLMGGKLIDLKFGRNRPKAMAQLGCYDLILQANEFDVQEVEIHWTQRIPQKRLQTPTERIPIGRRIAQRQALSIIRHAHRDLVHLLDKGDPWSLIANPSCRLCSEKHCPAWNTSFCEVGNEHD